MARLILSVSIILILLIPKDNTFMASSNASASSIFLNHSNLPISEMEALDLVKALYAANFEQVIPEQDKDRYYYRLPDADYFLEAEGTDLTGQNYIIHLYEFVLDDPEAGIGHTVTYGWYLVDISTGLIEDVTW